MKLVFYSGGEIAENKQLDLRTVDLCNSSDPTLAFIPACSYQSDIEYFSFVRQFRKQGVSRFLHFPIDMPFDQVMLDEVFNCDMIHLGGGNTYYFLHYLRKNKIMHLLKSFVKRGGVLTGLSAGGIIMTPNIETAGFPHFDCDENEDKIKNFKSLNLVRFEFFPHYKNSIRYDRELIKYSKKINTPLYACPDGSGIVVEYKNTMFIGKTYCFYQGRKFTISSVTNAPVRSA